jgi:hypothetical protein
MNHGFEPTLNSRWRAVLCSLVGTLVWVSPLAAGAVSLVNGRSARFQDKAGTSHDSVTVRFAREPGMLTPLPDPRCPADSSVSIVTDTQSVGPIALGCTFWRTARSGYVYRDADGTAGGVKRVVFKHSAAGGSLTLKLKGDGYGVNAIAGPAAFVEVSLVVGGITHCGRFEAPLSSFRKNLVDQISIKGPSRACEAAAGALNRPADPVVLTGADVASLNGIPPGSLVAFRYASGSWTQVPVQVDERDVINFNDVYNNTSSYGGNFTRLDYTDAGTFTGPDSNPTLDADDEIVFMARDAGQRPPGFSEPAGVIAASGAEIQVVDPLGGTAYVYLFRQDGSLDPAAGQSYVSYQFNLLSGAYKTTYGIASGPNAEESSVATAYYARHFADRWIQDELRILAGGASGVDILDRHKALFAPGVCVRSEDTFSSGEGAFVINKSGPVRAIRSYVGANSGPRTQRQHLFYERREDMTTFLRVHAIPGILDFFDYSPAASGMTYRNAFNASGVLIDGVPDTINTTASDWELVAGAQGSLTMIGSTQTDFAVTNIQTYYLDDSTPPVTQCTGDAFAYGSSGLWLNQGIPNTDPANPPASTLTGTRIMYYDAPGLAVADAQLRRYWTLYPLTVSVSAWQ